MNIKPPMNANERECKKYAGSYARLLKHVTDYQVVCRTDKNICVHLRSFAAKNFLICGLGVFNAWRLQADG